MTNLKKNKIIAVVIMRVKDNYYLLMDDETLKTQGFNSVQAGLNHFESAYHDRIRNPGYGAGVRATSAILHSIMNDPSVIEINMGSFKKWLTELKPSMRACSISQEWGYFTGSLLKNKKLAAKRHKAGVRPSLMPPEMTRK